MRRVVILLAIIAMTVVLVGRAPISSAQGSAVQIVNEQATPCAAASPEGS